MYKELTSFLALGLVATAAQAGEIVNDDFSFAPGATTGLERIDGSVWTDGGGFQVTNTEQLRVTTFGGGFGFVQNDSNLGARNDSGVYDGSPNAAPLLTNVGYASMSIAEDAFLEAPLAGNFLITAENTNFPSPPLNTNTNSNNAILDIRFGAADGIANPQLGDAGVGDYEFLWNNSLSAEDYTLPISGLTGTINSGQVLVVRDGSAVALIHDETDRNASVSIGSTANAYHFWVAVQGSNMLVDDFILHDSIPNAVAALIGDYDGSGFVSQSDLDLVLLNWGSSTIPAEWVATDQFDGVQVSQNELDGVLLNWGAGTPPPAGVAAVPEPASLALLGLGGLALASRRRR